MQNLPDLSQLSHAQKDDLIQLLWPLQQQVQGFTAQMLVMQERIKELEGRLAYFPSRQAKPRKGGNPWIVDRNLSSES
jgi:hypothetical protein